jgi:hypothetical protein
MNINNFIAGDSMCVLSKYDNTTGNSKNEWDFIFGGGTVNPNITINFYDKSAGARIGRYSSTSRIGDIGSWHNYGFTYSGNSSNTGIKIYRDAVRIDDNNDSGGVYVAMENMASKVGNYRTTAAGAKSYFGNYRVGVQIFIAEELTVTQVKDLDIVLRSYLDLDVAYL